MKPGPGFLDHLAWARGPGTKSYGTIVYRVATQVLPIALPELSWCWMVLLGPRSADHRQALLCLIATVELQDVGPLTYDHGRCASDHGALVVDSLGWGLIANYLIPQ